MNTVCTSYTPETGVVVKVLFTEVYLLVGLGPLVDGIGLISVICQWARVTAAGTFGRGDLGVIVD